MADYQYAPVDETAFEVRFLILLPGEREDPVQGLLFNRRLTKENFPSYEALSYAWGSEEYPLDIAIRTTDVQEAMLLLNSTDNIPSSRGYRRSKIKEIISSIKSQILPSKLGLSRFDKLSVTQNLGRALPYLRLRDRPRVFWIDAICVNQRDLRERSQQVQRMADLYRMASRVIVWLGEQTNNSELALNTLKWFSSNVTFDFESNILSAVSKNEFDEHWADLSVPFDLEKVVFLSLLDLFKRSWFHRLWVWQEIHLADQTSSLLVCGTGEILWQNFRSAVMALYYKSFMLLEQDDQRTLNDFVELRRQMYLICNDVPRYGFESLINFTKSSQCSDQKDRIYALLSLFQPHEINIQPDYTKTMECVFQETVSSYMHKTNSLNLLSICELNPKRSSKLPSWAPDFSVPKSTKTIFPRIMASTLSKSPGFESEDMVLPVSGVRISTVQWLCESKIGPTSSDFEISTNLNKVVSKIDIQGQYSSGERMAEAFFRTIVANGCSEMFEPIDLTYLSINAMQGFLEYLSDFQSNSTNSKPLPPNLDTLYTFIREYLTGRSVFITTEKHMGICPVFALLGDIVVLLVGCQIPLILRPQENGTYLVIGEAYCHGIMFGEPFLGSLPSGIDCFRSRAELWPLFKNRETGEATCEDPRLGDLPAGWNRVGHEREKEYSIFLDEKTGKRYYSLVLDPRTFPEEIEKRGVKLEDFKLA